MLFLSGRGALAPLYKRYLVTSGLRILLAGGEFFGAPDEVDLGRPPEYYAPDLVTDCGIVPPALLDRHGSRD
jgi:hypothetical protein